MKDEVLINNIKFWIDQNIIYCKFYNEFDEETNGTDIQEIFRYAISVLSKNKHLPVIINMRAINYSLSIKIFKSLSNSSLINKLVLSKTFLVDSYRCKILLSIYSFASNSVIPNTVFINYDSAIKNCNKNYKLFNTLILK